MRNELLLLAALLAAPTVTAQEKKAPPAPADATGQAPNPKVAEHDALKMLAGDWDTTCKMAAMPGVPGMDKPSESKGPEHTELICNGLWSKSTINGTFNGAPFQGVWLVGYDSTEKKYATIWVSNQDEPPCVGTGSYDAKTRTWTFNSPSPMGPVRSTIVFKDNDNSVETCFMTGKDGKETQCMEITRKRASKPAAVAAEAAAKAPSKELESVYEGLGTWNATIKMSGAGAPASEEKGIEKVVPICVGKWVWCDFNGTMMGGPFEGHGITGYDPIEKKYVSFWIDSMTANHMKTTGTYDAAKKAFTFDGTCKEGGKTMTVHQVMTQPDPNTRILNMTFKEPSGTMQMDITYKKAAAK
jgi:hypothetical protein